MNKTNIVKAFDAFMALGKMRALDGKFDKQIYDNAMKTLTEVCAQEKTTVDQLGQMLMNFVLRG